MLALRISAVNLRSLALVKGSEYVTDWESVTRRFKLTLPNTNDFVPRKAYVLQK